MLDRVTKWTQAGGNGGTPESGTLFLFRVRNRYPSFSLSFHPPYFQKDFESKRRWDFGDVTNENNMYELQYFYNISFSIT